MRTIPEQRQSEFSDLETLAMGYLETPHSVPKADELGKWRFCLRLWHFPSFVENRAWGLYQYHERGSRQVRSLVRQVTWDRPADGRRFFEPLVGLEHGYHVQPTIEVRDRPLVTEELEERLRELEKISFPAFASSGIGIDGETFGVARPGVAESVQWSCGGPESWNGLTSWASSMRGWLASVAAAEPQFDLWKAPRPKLP